MDNFERARACADILYAGDEAARTLGIEVVVPSPGSAVATMRVREDMINGFNICHGGVLFTLADTAFAFACNAYDDLTVAASGTIEYLRPVNLNDEIRAVAIEDYRGRRSGVYTVEVFDQEDELVALFRGRSVSRGERLLDE
ncbi:MAG: hydroxyphenylacetyl-CoA thioesterase PaaI [Woeseiaceae bacterium]